MHLLITIFHLNFCFTLSHGFRLHSVNNINKSLITVLKWIILNSSRYILHSTGNHKFAAKSKHFYKIKVRVYRQAESHSVIIKVS